MILSIRHRILLPFLFITVFMTFSAMFISIELVQNHFDNQLRQHAQQHFLPVETTLHQLAIESFLASQRPNASPILLADINAMTSSITQLKAGIEDQSLYLTRPNDPTKMPFSISSSNFNFQKLT